MRTYILNVVTENRQEVFEMWFDEVNKGRRKNNLSTVSEEMFQSTNREFYELILQNIHKDQHGLTEQLMEFAERLIQLGWPLGYLTEGLQIFRQVVLEVCFEKSKDKPLELIKGIDSWIDPIINQMVNSYSGSWEQIFSLQKTALQELSSPLIPIFENITVMPLIGTVDTERAKLIMENLLEGVVKHRSEVVLIDITGVPVVDTMVAHHIIQAIDAVRLIGAKCILVGIRPEIAQTIVNLGIDLSNLPTQSTMRKGFEAALEMINRKIVGF